MAGTPANALNVNAIGMLYLGSFNNQVVSIAPGLANTVLASSGIGSVPGFSNLGALGGVTSIITNSGTATPASGVINLSGTNSGNSLTFSGASNNIQLNIQDSGGNIFLGILSGNTSHDGSAEFNVGIGGNTLEDINNSAIGNVAISSQSLQSLTSGNGNIAISDQSLINLLTGSNNIALGSATGTNYSSSEYSNILIGGGITGTESEHNVLRIGNGTGTSAGQLNNAFVSGINGNTSASPAIVTTDTTTDQLGTMPYVKNATFTPTLNFCSGICRYSICYWNREFGIGRVTSYYKCSNSGSAYRIGRLGSIFRLAMASRMYFIRSIWTSRNNYCTNRCIWNRRSRGTYANVQWCFSSFIFINIHSLNLSNHD